MSNLHADLVLLIWCNPPLDLVQPNYVPESERTTVGLHQLWHVFFRLEETARS